MTSIAREVKKVRAALDVIHKIQDIAAKTMGSQPLTKGGDPRILQDRAQFLQQRLRTLMNERMVWGAIKKIHKVDDKKRRQDKLAPKGPRPSSQGTQARPGPPKAFGPKMSELADI